MGATMILLGKTKGLPIILLQPERTENPTKKDDIASLLGTGLLSANPVKKKAPPKQSPKGGRRRDQPDGRPDSFHCSNVV